MRRLVRFSAVVLVTACTFGAFAQGAHSALFFLFRPTLVHAGQYTTIRPAGTPGNFKQSQRTRPFQPPMRVYLVLNDVAGEVTSQDDARLHSIGSLVVGKNGGILRFKVPRLPPGDYAAAVVCPACARYSSSKQTFFVLNVDDNISTYWRPLMLLRIRADVTDEWQSLHRPLHVPHVDAGDRCPVADSAEVVGGQAMNGTEPAFLMGVGDAPAGVIYLGSPDSKGWRGQKTPWLVPSNYGGPVLVRGARIDDVGPVRFAQGYGQHLTELRYASGKSNGTAAGHRFLASASLFRAEGCYAFQIDGTSFSRVVVMRVRG